jgi:hypothetical protein
MSEESVAVAPGSMTGAQWRQARAIVPLATVLAHFSPPFQHGAK